VQEIISGPGYVLPSEIRSQLVRGGTEWTVSVATADFNAFTPDVPVNELNLAAWFEQNIERYQTPTRVSVDYVSFKPAEFAQDVTFTEDELLAFYKANPARFPGSTDDTTAAADSGGIPLAFRGAVEGALRTELASKRAARAAETFAEAILDRKIVRGSTGLEDLIKTHKATRNTAPLFSASEPPKELNWPASVAQEAFNLSDRRYYSGPLSLADGSTIILLWNETIPPATPTLAQVRDAVVRDFTAAERRRMFVEAGRQWRDALAARMASGQSLEAAAAAMGTPKFEVVGYPAFSRRTPPEGIAPAALSALEQTGVGELSGFIPTGEKGILVHVAARKEPAIDENSPEYAAARTQLARLSANLGQNVVLSALVERELGKFADLDR
jgi:peptidyl-prolyl cis-trans isomerase D